MTSLPPKALFYWPFARGIHQSTMDSPHKGSVMRNAFSCTSAVEENLALGKDTWQHDISSNHASMRAVDGNFDPVIGGASCIQTSSKYQAWWAVDLEDSYKIDRVVLATRDSGSKYICTHIFVRTCAHNQCTPTHKRLVYYTYMHIYTYSYISIYLYIYISIYIYINMHAWMIRHSAHREKMCFIDKHTPFQDLLLIERPVHGRARPIRTCSPWTGLSGSEPDCLSTRPPMCAGPVRSMLDCTAGSKSWGIGVRALLWKSPYLNRQTL